MELSSTFLRLIVSKICSKYALDSAIVVELVAPMLAKCSFIRAIRPETNLSVMDGVPISK